MSAKLNCESACDLLEWCEKVKVQSDSASVKLSVIYVSAHHSCISVQKWKWCLLIKAKTNWKLGKDLC